MIYHLRRCFYRRLFCIAGWLIARIFILSEAEVTVCGTSKVWYNVIRLVAMADQTWCVWLRQKNMARGRPGQAELPFSLNLTLSDRR